MNQVKIAMVQMEVKADKGKNIKAAVGHVESAARSHADIVVLPEMFCCPYEASNFPVYAEKEGGEAWKQLSAAAKENSVYLVAGSVPEIDDDNRVYNTSYVFDRGGCRIARHRKIHLFDIQVDGGQCFKESDTLAPGRDVTVFNTEFCRIGLAVCYDFRFPELARLMADDDARIIIVPAAFNMTTGPAHWEVLFRSRAIDNQVFTVGAAPARDLSASYCSYANSIIVSPWGEILTRMDEGEGISVTALDLEQVSKIRKQLPLLAHRRKDIYTVSRKCVDTKI